MLEGFQCSQWKRRLAVLVVLALRFLVEDAHVDQWRAENYQSIPEQTQRRQHTKYNRMRQGLLVACVDNRIYHREPIECIRVLVV